MLNTQRTGENIMRTAREGDSPVVPQKRVTYEDGVQPKKGVTYVLDVHIDRESGLLIVAVNVDEHQNNAGDRPGSFGKLKSFPDYFSIDDFPDGNIGLSLVKSAGDDPIRGFERGLAILLAHVAKVTIGLE